MAGASSGGDSRGPTALSDLPQFDNVEFITVCKFTRFAPDDPIVHYKMPGMSHDHSFFGNVDDERVHDAEDAAPRRDVLPAAGGHRVVLGADAAGSTTSASRRSRRTSTTAAARSRR